MEVRRSVTKLGGRGWKRKRVQRDCSAGMILLTKLQMRQKRAFLTYFSITAGGRSGRADKNWSFTSIGLF